MADTKTTHLELIKQDPDTLPDYLKDFTNLEKLDAEIFARGKKFNGESVNEDGEFNIRSVPEAENLKTSSSQQSEGTFIARTTGGSASIESGPAWLALIKGVRKHVGYVPQSITHTISPLERVDELQVSIDEADFVSKVPASTTIALVYSTVWTVGGVEVDPVEDYGITITGEPLAGDAITVVYVKEVRGTIVHSDPTAFISTGWNLYNHTSGYARVVKYSDEYGFKISGTYSLLEFAETLSGTRTTIDPVSGFFTIPSDGYLFVTGGNNTNTAIWMTWGDWDTTYKGDFQTYSESIVDFSSFMLQNFPYGLLQVGDVQDEINLNVGSATSNVLRQAYNSTNLANAKSSGRQYEYDENYIYIERETPVVYTISVEGDYDSNDHGMEMFTGTDQEVFAQTIYGANLRNKLERDVLTVSQQSLSSAEKKQVQDNIGVTTMNDALLDIIGSLLTVENKTVFDNQSITAGQFEDGTFSIAKTGYTPIAVAGYNVSNGSSSGSGRTWALPCKMYISGTNLTYSIRNLSSSNIKIKLNAYILYRKNLT